MRKRYATFSNDMLRREAERMGGCGVGSADLPPLRPKRDFPDRWVFVVCYIGMGVLLSPVARYHYGPEATFKWVLMSALWPLEVVWWLWRVQQRL